MSSWIYTKNYCSPTSGYVSSMGPCYKYTKSTNDGEIQMSIEKSAVKRVKNSKKQPEFNSEILKWYSNEIGFNLAEYYLLVHSPMYNNKNSKLVRDFDTLYNDHRLMFFRTPIEHSLTYTLNNFPGAGLHYKAIFVDSVLEHMQGHMARALALKKLMYQLYEDRISTFLILHTLSKNSVEHIANKYKLLSDGGKYTIPRKDGTKMSVEGIDTDEATALVTYARINSIVKVNYKLFKRSNDGCIIINSK